MAENPHRLNDLRSLAIHREVATRLRADPSLLAGPRRRVEQWLTSGAVHPFYARAWSGLTSGPMEDLLRLLGDESERATDLRHCSPFAGLVDPQTRWRIWKQIPRDAASGG